MVANGNRAHTRADFFYNAAAFMSENSGENAFGVVPAEGECVGMANAGGGEFDKHFASGGRGEIYFFNG